MANLIYIPPNINPRDIELHLSGNKLVETVEVEQYDSKSVYIRATVYNNGELYRITESETVDFISTKPNGDGICNSCGRDFEGNIIYEITANTTAQSGWFDAQFKIYDSNGGVKSTPKFKMSVNRSALSNDAIIGAPEFNALDELITDATDAIKTVADINNNEQSRINNENTRIESEEERIVNEAKRPNWVKLTQAQYDALSIEEKMSNTFYEIMDDDGEVITDLEVLVDDLLQAKTAYDASVTAGSNTEVVNARKSNVTNTSYSLIGDRMNAFDSQLAQKANELKVVSLESRMDKFTNLPIGSTTGDAELIDGHVGANGETYNNIGGHLRKIGSALNFVVSKNMYNINTDVGNTGLTSVGAKWSGAGNFYVSDYIEVIAGKIVNSSILFNGKQTKALMARVCAYDNSKQFISNSKADDVYTYAIPAGAKYILVQVPTSSRNASFQLEYDAITEYKAYHEPYYDAGILDLEDTKNNMNLLQQSIVGIQENVIPSLKPTVLLTFDETPSIYTNRYDLVKNTYGFNATFAINEAFTSELGVSSITRSQVIEMINNGWDWAQYAGDGAYPTEGTAVKNDWKLYIKTMKDRLESYGLYNPVCYFPKHNYGDDYITEAIKECGFKLMRTQWLWGTNKEFIKTLNTDTFKTYTVNVYSGNISTVKGYIDTAIANNWAISIFTHRLVNTTAEESGGSNCARATYIELLDYIKEKHNAGLLDVLTYRQFYNKYLPKQGNEFDYDRTIKTQNWITKRMLSLT